MSDLCPVAVDTTHWKGPQPSTVAEANLFLLKQKRLCDVVFTFENSSVQIEAHQFCLRARSPVFDFKLRGRGSFGQRIEILVPDTTPEMFQEFLEFIYADKFEVDFTGALELLQIAHTYKVEPLIAKCKAVLEKEIHAENAVQVFQTAHKLGDFDDLKLKALGIIAGSLNTLCWDQKFLKDVQEETLTCLLKRDDLPLKEVDLFKLAVRWGKQHLQGEAAIDNKALKKKLVRVIPLIRYFTMSPEEFTNVVLLAQLLNQDEVIDVYAYMNGAPAVRESVAARRKFNTVPRKGCAGVVISMFEEDCNSEPCDKRGNFPLNECLSFYVSKIGPKGRHTNNESKQKLAITGILFQWPTRSVSPTPPPSERLDFSVGVMRFAEQKVSDQSLDCKFQTTALDCTPGELIEISVPPMELMENMDYCITVKDEYKGDYGNEWVQFYYSWQTELQEIKQSTDAVLGSVEVKLEGIQRNGDLREFPKHTYECVQTIRGIRIAPI